MLAPAWLLGSSGLILSSAAREYEFAAVGVFFAGRVPGLLRRTLASFGHDLDGGVPRRLLAWLLLHRYSCLPWYFRRLPGPPERWPAGK